MLRKGKRKWRGKEIGGNEDMERKVRRGEREVERKKRGSGCAIGEGIGGLAKVRGRGSRGKYGNISKKKKIFP